MTHVDPEKPVSQKVGWRENLMAINSFVRTLIALVVVSFIGMVSWISYDFIHSKNSALKETQQELRQVSADLEKKSQEVVELQTTVAEKQQLIDQLDTAMRFLKVDRRMAELTVIKQAKDNQSGELQTTVRFEEVDDDGKTLGQAKEFTVQGDLVYIDHWVVKFADQYVEEGALDKGTSLCLFKGLFGEFQKPSDAFSLDRSGERPAAYGRTDRISEFEQQIWDHFWEYANDPERAVQQGIRAAHGNAASIRVQPGKRYRLLLRASGGISIQPGEAVKPVRPAA